MFLDYDLIDPRYVAAVSTAIDEARLFFHVQGIHDVQSPSKVLYYECLARLKGTDGKIYDASDFVPALELLSKTAVLDNGMIRLVLDQLEEEPTAALGCNISADTISKEEDWRSIIDQISARKNLANRLVLEIIETRPLGLMSQLNEHLDEARKLGCKIAIDDFGAGYLPPIQLYDLDPDIIKLDAGFIWAARQDNTTLQALRHFIQFSASFAPNVIIEGVETELDLMRAQLAGATHIQGWFLSSPTPPNCKPSKKSFVF